MSPQAVVWNMKRYNKVKAACDDRKRGGRPAAKDKDKAAEYLRDLMAETHRTGSRIKMVEIVEKVSEEFGLHVSPTWTSKLMKRYEIPHKEPKPPKVKKVRIPKPPKPSKAPKQPAQSSWVPQYTLPAPGQYPLFREDLQQAMVAGPSPGRLVDVGPRAATALPPAERLGRPPKNMHNDGYAPDFEGFGILKLSKPAPPPLALPPISS
jgi:transposase